MARGDVNERITLVVNFGAGQTGKTVGYTLKNGDGTTFQARTTTGVSELQAGSGQYKVEIASTVFTAFFDGYVLWDVAGAAPYASEDIFVSDRLDAAVSTRSTYAGADTAGTGTLLSRLTGTRATNLDNLDHASSDLDTELDALAVSVAALPTAAAIATAVWAAAARTLTAISDSAGVTTLVSRLTAGRATNLDNLDAAVSSRSTYAGADTAGTATLLSRLTAGRAGNLDFLDTSIAGLPAAVAAAVWAAATRTLSSVTAIVSGVWNEATAGHQTAGTTGKALTDGIGGGGGGGGDPWATELDGSYSGDEAGAIVLGIKGKTDQLGAVSVTVRSPVATTGSLALFVGNDYFNVDGRALDWTETAGGWPDLTGATIQLQVDPGPNPTLEKTGSVVTAGAAPQQVRVELAAADTNMLRVGAFNYELVGTLPSGHKVTLAAGNGTAI